MQKKSFTEQIIENYSKKYLENAESLDFKEIVDAKLTTSVLYKDLPNTIMEGYPFGSDYVDANNKSYNIFEFAKLSKEKKANCDLRYLYMPYSHELYIGTTGSGKTTGCVEPQIRAISSQKNRPNLFITDPKGELYEHNAFHLKEQGYNVFVLNFKDYTHTDRWNPLLEMYEKKMELATMGEGSILKTGKVPDDLVQYGNEEDFKNDLYIEYKGKAFPNGNVFDSYLRITKDILSANIDSLVNQLTLTILPIKSKNDATWEMGAQQLFKGLLQLMLYEAADKESGFTKDMMTFKTLEEYYNCLRNSLTNEHSSYKFNNHPLLKDKPSSVTNLLRIALNNAPRTMLSYLGVFEGATKDWFQGHIYALTTGNTINLDSEDDKPFAIFTITRDYEKSDFTIAGLFIDWVYKQTLLKIENKPLMKNGKSTVRATHFLLDEFGNIPEIPDFDNKIATSRSRNIWFHLFVQSYEQIRITYDGNEGAKKKSQVICDNCNAQIFLGAQSRENKKIFSEECGQHYIPALEAQINPQITEMIQVPVLPISDLDLIEPGEMFIKRLYTPVIKSQYVRSYICAENEDFKNFFSNNSVDNKNIINLNAFNDPRFEFEKLKQFMVIYASKDDDYDF